MADKPEKCDGCIFYEEDYVNDDGDHVEGWGCCNPNNCPLPEKEK